MTQSQFQRIVAADASLASADGLTLGEFAKANGVSTKTVKPVQGGRCNRWPTCLITRGNGLLIT